MFKSLSSTFFIFYNFFFAVLLNCCSPRQLFNNSRCFHVCQHLFIILFHCRFAFVCISNFYKISYYDALVNTFSKNCVERRKRDLNPRAAINDLLPFQGSPFSLLGISPDLKFSMIPLPAFLNRHYTAGLSRKRKATEL